MNNDALDINNARQGSAKRRQIIIEPGSIYIDYLNFIFSQSSKRRAGLVGAPGVVGTPGCITDVPVNVVSTPAGIVGPTSTNLIRTIEICRAPVVDETMDGVERNEFVTITPYNVWDLTTTPDWIETPPGDEEKPQINEINPGGSQTEPSQHGTGHDCQPLGT